MPAFAPDESLLEVRWAVDNSVVAAEDVAVDLLEDNIVIPGFAGAAVEVEVDDDTTAPYGSTSGAGIWNVAGGICT